jgi:hypothetical protein
MTYYADLSAYDYLPDTVPASVTTLTVGWLDREHEFPIGTVTEEFAARLAELCAGHRSGQTRGHHPCRLCPKGGRYPVTESVGGQAVALGSAEIRVRTEAGSWLIAPDLVLHYVITHRYQPPAEFVEAVMSGRMADSDAG